MMRVTTLTSLQDGKWVFSYAAVFLNKSHAKVKTKRIFKRNENQILNLWYGSKESKHSENYST